MMTYRTTDGTLMNCVKYLPQTDEYVQAYREDGKWMTRIARINDDFGHSYKEHGSKEMAKSYIEGVK